MFRAVCHRSLLVVAAGVAFGLVAPRMCAAALEKLADGIVVPLDGAWLELEVRADDIVRVAYAKERSFFSRDSLVVGTRAAAVVGWNVESDERAATLATARLRVRVELATGTVTFFDVSGKAVLAERSRTMEPATVQGEPTFHVRQQWTPNADESLYGLGQNQLGLLDLKGHDLELWQRNTNIVVPFLASSRGYGILWDNASFTKFGDPREFGSIPAECLRDAAGRPGGLTRGTFNAAEPEHLQDAQSTSDLDAPPAGPSGRNRASTRWSGEIAPTASGDYQFQTYSNGGIKVWIDGRLVIDHWRQAWLTEYDQAKLRLEAGRRYPIKIEWGGEQATTMQLRWKAPAPSASASGTSLWSEVSEGIDYFFVYGPSLDRVIAGCRELTEAAPMMPRWAFGLWQSRQRYETAQQSLDVVDEYRRRGIPFDNIVQDWQYWPENAWGSHRFDAKRFPDPDAWIRALHERHARVMISVWGKFYSGDYPGSENFAAMQNAGFLYQPTLTEGTRDWVGRGGYNFAFYDAFNAGARKMFWDQIDTALFRRGVDAWWMDATEPDVVQPSPPTLATVKHFIGTTALGPASRVLNAYPLENSRAIYEGQRSAAPDQRVFILTRSAFAGSQRYAAAAWSGDITSTWTALAKQIPAGLGLSLSGVPYWTTDSGGYTMQARFAAKNQKAEDAEEWRELNTRWFQFATFCPLLRLHGEQQPREPWTFGGDTDPAYQAIVKFDRLRYRLLPYLYSLAGAVTRDGGTFMRPLVMDFPGDAIARTTTDEFMFGPALLVAPVTTFRARSRAVFLPATPGGWFDFWNGAVIAGGQAIDAPAPYDALPLHVRAGAIVPFGPELHYADERPADPITLFVYAGADGGFTLYEDDGVSYGYERGECARIPLRWDDAARTLTIGRREGVFPGMLAERTFELVLVAKDKPVGFSFSPQPDETVRYRGEAVNVRFGPVR